MIRTVSISLLLAVTACTKNPPPTLSHSSAPLPPAKEQLVVWGPESFSLSDFYTLHAVYPSLRPAYVVQMGMMSLSLRKAGKDLPPERLCELLRPLFEPLPSGFREGSWLQAVNRELFSAKSLADARLQAHRLLPTKSGSEIQLNAPLLKEIGAADAG